MIAAKRLHPLFAAEITDLAVSAPIPDAVFSDIEAAFRRHSVLVFRDQPITDDQQIAFSERFGALETTKVGTAGAGGKLIVLSNMDEGGAVVPASDRQVLNNRANRLWHADSSFKAVPAKASMLSARLIPSKGGDTEYISMRAVYAALPGRLKQAVENKVVIHDYAYSRSKIDPALVTDAERAAVPPVRQAMVIDHGADLGRSLYLGAHAARIEGMAEDEGRALIDELMAFATQERFVYAHKWQPHDLILWDNRAVIHRATPFESATEKRLMVRTTIAGDAPTLVAAA
ncbi:TauD/TfdA family dioxygenase [Thalassobaculum sp. OXR-137]|uniref:TauD/TfdA dioxygenase family protein n=1 Tax=Thalassobaculum sp. OXR-137 TaxID=3100173 RepID=UPI002AC8E7E0|nr:TauD/TfdA family dioxygenase [Thalassobaculum sp. OXR-137]WPZ35881.1 TauD/TfdA family dioxygenase [Thalassobaculum sp. OXR-137]